LNLGLIIASRTVVMIRHQKGKPAGNAIAVSLEKRVSGKQEFLIRRFMLILEGHDGAAQTGWVGSPATAGPGPGVVQADDNISFSIS